MNAVTRPGQTVAIRPVLEPTTFDQLMIFSEKAAQSDLVPKDYKGKPANIFLAVQMGSELGLSPMQSLLSIAVINGRAGVWGDGLIGLCRASPLCQDIVETFEGDGDSRVAVCVATRLGSTPVTSRFSVADAKKAQLWGKNVWATYPDRMLQNRARGFSLRDAFPDLLRGLKTVEELRDTPADTYQGMTLDARPEPAAAPEPPATKDPNGTGGPTPGPRQPVPPSKRYPVLYTANNGAWLAELIRVLGAAGSRAEVEEIGGLGPVNHALSNAPTNIVADIKALLSDAFARFVETPHDPETGEIDDSFPGDRPNV
jgi:hypothetical protein